MSTINKTPNLGLTQYEGVTYPLFFGDYSHDMGVIDALIKSIEIDIDAIQQVIDTVSTQNIDDLIARLYALEVKVDNNANAINSLLTSLSGLTTQVDNNKAQIRNLQNGLESAQSDIDELKRCCDNVLSILNQHDAKITENEIAIENINNEIARIKENVIGNAQDIQTLATQISSLMESKQDKLIEGVGIRIDGNVISSTGGGGVVGTYDSSTENLSLG